jgi:PiT family inorganic phosphate transporter
VLRALFVSPLLGFCLAGLLFRVLNAVISDRALFEPTAADRLPPWWVRGLLVLTCSGVSFAHGSNDGQTSIGLIMPTIIGIMPATVSLNPEIGAPSLPAIVQAVWQAEPRIQRHGGNEKHLAVADARHLVEQLGDVSALSRVPDYARPAVRDAVHHVNAALKAVAASRQAPEQDRAAAKALQDRLHGAVEYAPIWVRMLSAVCLGLGTMIGYRRIVVTLGERIGKRHLTPAQGPRPSLSMEC